MVVKLPGIPKRPGPQMIYSVQGHTDKSWIMLEHAAAMQRAGMKVLFLSLDPRRS